MDQIYDRNLPRRRALAGSIGAAFAIVDAGLPRAVRAMTTVRRYVRNFIDGAVGAQPDLDVISEFGFPMGNPGVNVCGHRIDPNWIKSRSGPVSDGTISGTQRSFENGPTRKRAILVRPSSAADFDKALATFAQTTANQLGALTDTWERRPIGWRIVRREAVWFVHSGDPSVIAAAEGDLR